MNGSIHQQTLKNSVRATGLALHTGKQVNLILGPGPVDSGIVFRRTDLNEEMSVHAHALNVGSTHMATSLTNGQDEISTIEHLMSAFSGLGIDNAVVEVNAAELPIMDGSAATFVFLVQSAGIEAQSAAKKFIRIKKPIRVSGADGLNDYGQRVELLPHSGFKVSHTIIYDNAVIKEQHASIDFANTDFVKAVSRARTFGLMQEFEQLREMNLVQGGSLDNAIVVDEYRVLNADGLRHDDEFVRHKILDAIGDLYLLGHSILGEFIGYKSGHTENHALRTALLAQPDAWDVITFGDRQKAPSAYSNLGGLDYAS